MRRQVPLATTFIIFIVISLVFGACRNGSSDFTIALYEKITALDPVTAQDPKAANDRVRALLFNSLVKKNEKFEYVPDLASKIDTSADGTVYTFTLHDNVKFHDGRRLTSADAKYTLDTLLANQGAPKAASFFENVNGQKVPNVAAIDTPDPKTLVIRLSKPWPALLSNLVPIGIIPQNSIATQNTHPIGSGPFKFVAWDSAQGFVDLEANNDYWEGAPQIKKIRVRPIEDANALQAELNSGRVDLAPFPTNVSPDALEALKNQGNLQVVQAPGSNITYLNFNVQADPVSNSTVRQAIAYAIDRTKIVSQLLRNQGEVANSILPEESWAFAPGQKYSYDPQKAKQLLDQAGFRDPDGDGPQMRFAKPLTYSIASNSVTARQYAQVIQDDLKKVGIPVEIETMETAILIDRQKKGQFQIASGNWVGGNQDPVFLKDLFDSTGIPPGSPNGRNRSRYNNAEFDKLIEEATSTTDREKAFGLYSRAQDILSRDIPMLPLWYPANLVIAKKNVSNIKFDASGDWSFIKNLKVG
jgi:peptide/nickel transport system substrate-binding protein